MRGTRKGQRMLAVRRRAAQYIAQAARRLWRRAKENSASDGAEILIVDVTIFRYESLRVATLAVKGHGTYVDKKNSIDASKYPTEYEIN